MNEKMPQRVRVRTSSNKDKALRQYDEVRNQAKMRGSLVIVEDKDGNVDVLGQGLRLEEITWLLYVAAKGVTDVSVRDDAKKSELKLDPKEADPEAKPEVVPGRKRIPEITKTSDGSLEAPKGESFIFCAECSCSKWFVTQKEPDMPVARMACISCGNEIKMLVTDPTTSTVQ